MHIAVCLKQILDPEVPARDFKVDGERRVALRGSASLVTNVFCENALELALQVRDREPGTWITVVSAGDTSVEDVLRKALALKVEQAVHVQMAERTHPAPAFVARTLAAAIRRLGQVDLVMVGRESGDWGSGQTGALIAEELGWGCLALVDRIERPADGAPGLLLRRQTDAGWERFAATPPLVVTVTNDEHNVPRLPKTRDVMLSYRQPLTSWTLGDLGLADLAAAESADAEVISLSIPVREAACAMAEGDTLDEKVAAFAQALFNVSQTVA